MSAHASASDIVARLDAAYGDAPRPIALHEPDLSGREAEYLQACVDEGWVSTGGRFVTRFGELLGEVIGTPNIVPTSTGTAALHTALILAGVGPGDEVLCPSLTFVATANAIAYQHASPHFVDCEPNTLGVDPARLEAYLASICDMEAGVAVNRMTGRPIRALIAVHVFGHPCDIRALRRIADAYGLVLIEDAAEALGSLSGDTPLGRFGDFAAFSFNGNKIVTAGAGGALACRREEDAARATHLTTTAKQPHKWAFEHDEVGYNYRLSNLNAALGVAQLERLDAQLADKRALADTLRIALSDLAGVDFFAEPERGASNYWLNALRLKTPDLKVRDQILDAAHASGLLCRPVWTPMHHLPMFSGAPRMPDLVETEAAHAALVNIPSSAALGAYTVAPKRVVNHTLMQP